MDNLGYLMGNLGYYLDNLEDNILYINIYIYIYIYIYINIYCQIVNHVFKANANIKNDHNRIFNVMDDKLYS